MTDATVTPERRRADIGPANDTGAFDIQKFIDSMMKSRLGAPVTVELRVSPALFDLVLAARAHVLEDITVDLAVTEIRQTWPNFDDPVVAFRLAPRHPFPEYEIEGYLLLNDDERPWVRVSLRTTDDECLREGTLYLLEPGEEHGTAVTPGMGG